LMQTLAMKDLTKLLSCSIFIIHDPILILLSSMYACAAACVARA